MSLWLFSQYGISAFSSLNNPTLYTARLFCNSWKYYISWNYWKNSDSWIVILRLWSRLWFWGCLFAWNVISDFGSCVTKRAKNCRGIHSWLHPVCCSIIQKDISWSYGGQGLHDRWNCTKFIGNICQCKYCPCQRDGNFCEGVGISIWDVISAAAA